MKLLVYLLRQQAVCDDKKSIHGELCEVINNDKRLGNQMGQIPSTKPVIFTVAGVTSTKNSGLSKESKTLGNFADMGRKIYIIVSLG